MGCSSMMGRHHADPVVVVLLAVVVVVGVVVVLIGVVVEVHVSLRVQVVVHSNSGKSILELSAIVEGKCREGLEEIWINLMCLWHGLLGLLLLLYSGLLGVGGVPEGEGSE